MCEFCYKKGYKDGLSSFAWFREGVAVVGSSATTLEKAERTMETDYCFNPPEDCRGEVPTEVPDELKSSLNRYVCDRIATGHFLRAVLENDLLVAVARADDENVNLIPQILRYIYNELPAACWGSKDAVKKWLERE